MGSVCSPGRCTDQDEHSLLLGPGLNLPRLVNAKEMTSIGATEANRSPVPYLRPPHTGPPGIARREACQPEPQGRAGPATGPAVSPQRTGAAFRAVEPAVPRFGNGFPRAREGPWERDRRRARSLERAVPHLPAEADLRDRDVRRKDDAEPRAELGCGDLDARPPAGRRNRPSDR